jgi:pimeloyl-ACP methyl ester carboxylesterase
LLGGFVRKADPAKKLGVEWHLAKTDNRGTRLFVFLPGRHDRAADFGRHGFIALAQDKIAGLDCVAVDATMGYYLDGSVANRLQHEIIEPAQAVGYQEIWLVGVSMGGLGAFFHQRTYPGKIRGLILLAPFVGDDRKLFAEIEKGGGAKSWAAGQPTGTAQPTRADYQRELWRFLGRLRVDDNSPLQIWVACGKKDRLLPGIERLKDIIPPERLLWLPGGHTWEVWTKGFIEILGRQNSEVRIQETGNFSPSPLN